MGKVWHAGGTRGIAAALICVFAVAAFAPARASAQTAPAKGQKVDLELILMVDASGSIDDDEFILQRIGYARAFSNPKVVSAIRDGPLGRIAVSYVEWTGPLLQAVIVPWEILSDAASVAAFSAKLEKTPRELFSGGTAVGNAIMYGARELATNAYAGSRRVIDVSGDGPTNRGMPAALARDEAVAQGITVNGLPILNNYPGLDEFYSDNVIGGPGAFTIPAKTFDDFSAAILTKLIREIAGRDAPADSQAADAERARPPRR